jgi:hypothetical protein
MAEARGVARALAAEDLALAGAEPLERLHVLPVDELHAEPREAAAALLEALELLLLVSLLVSSFPCHRAS